MNETKKEILPPTVELGGRLWELRLGHRAMRLYCQTTHCTMESFDATLDEYENNITLLYVMMLQQEPRLTREQLDELLDELPLGELFRLARDAIRAAFPQSDEAGEEDAGKDVPPTRSGTA